MLVLTRRLDESIIIGDNIEVKVLKISGNQVHLGIEAPKEVTLYRKEVYAKVVSENQRATRAAAVTPDMLSNLQTLNQRLHKPPAPDND